MARRAHDEGLLDVGLGVADELADDAEALAGDLRRAPGRAIHDGMVATVEPARRRSQRDGE